jgi:glutamyl-tRNA synthetase
MRNFLALLGWSPGDDREILTEREMIDAFSLEAIQKKPGIFDTTKLEWMNGQYLSMLPAEELIAPVRRELARMQLPETPGLHPIIDAVKTRSRTILHLAEQVAVRLDPTRVVPDKKATKLKQKMGPAFAANVGLALGALETLPEAEWNPDRLVQTLRDVAEANDLKPGDVMQPIRVALTGSTVSEPVNELLFVVGREPSLERLREVGTGEHHA